MNNTNFGNNPSQSNTQMIYIDTDKSYESDNNSGPITTNATKANTNWAPKEFADLQQLRKTITLQNKSNQHLRGNNFAMRQSMARMHDNEEEIEHLHAEIRSFKLQIRSLSKELGLNHSLRAQFDNIKTENVTLTNKVLQLQNQLVDNKCEFTGAKSLSKKCDWLKTRCDAFEDEIEGLKTEKREIQFDRDIKSQAFDREVSILKSSLLEAEREVTVTRKIIAEIRSENKKLVQEVQDKIDESAEFRTLMLDSEAVKASLKGETNSMRKSMDQIVAKSVALRDSYEQLVAENTNLYKMFQEGQSSLTSLRRLNNQIESKSALLAQEDEANKSVLSQLVAIEYKDQIEQFSSFSRSNAVVREVVDFVLNLRQQSNSMEEQNSRERQNFKRCFEEQIGIIDDLKAEANQLKSRVTELDIDSMGLNIENRRLKGLLDGLRRQLRLYEDQGSRVDIKENTPARNSQAPGRHLYIAWNDLFEPEPSKNQYSRVLPSVYKSDNGSYMRAHLRHKELMDK